MAHYTLKKTDSQGDVDVVRGFDTLAEAQEGARGYPLDADDSLSVEDETGRTVWGIDGLGNEKLQN